MLLYGHLSFSPDLDGLRTDCQHAKQSGFTGKTLIHPSHVSVANEVFSPPAKQVAWARGLLDAYARHNADGQVRHSDNPFSSLCEAWRLNYVPLYR